MRNILWILLVQFCLAASASANNDILEIADVKSVEPTLDGEESGGTYFLRINGKGVPVIGKNAVDLCLKVALLALNDSRFGLRFNRDLLNHCEIYKK